MLNYLSINLGNRFLILGVRPFQQERIVSISDGW